MVDHPAGRTVVAAGAPYLDQARHSSGNLLPLVRPIQWRRAGGADRCSPRPDRVWNRIPDDVRQRIIQLAIQEPALSPRELAVRFTDSQSYFAPRPRSTAC